MNGKMLIATAAMLLGFGFAYLQRNSFEGMGVYGIILGIIGAVVFARANTNFRS
jgi:hypothetical protein